MIKKVAFLGGRHLSSQSGAVCRKLTSSMCFA